MTFPDLYNRLLPLWGNPLFFADGAMLEHKNPFLALGKLKGQQNPSAGKEHFYSQEFSYRWEQAEKAISPADLLEKQVVWAMYQVFHDKAQQLFTEGVFSFTPSGAEMAKVQERLLKNLQQSGYEEELALYQKLSAAEQG